MAAYARDRLWRTDNNLLDFVIRHAADKGLLAIGMKLAKTQGKVVRSINDGDGKVTV